MTSNKYILLLAGILSLSSCNQDFSWIPEHDKPRIEYAPNMYHSESYEPLTQIMDEHSGSDVEFENNMVFGHNYNSNPYNRYPENGYTPMTMREPAANTIKRGFNPYHLAKDDVEQSRQLRNPLEPTEAVLSEGEVLYTRFCLHCHGATGGGDGKVNDAFKGVANLTTAQAKQMEDGYIYHVITHGIRRMWAHGSQIPDQERWKIVHYVKHVLQRTEE